MYQVIEIDGRRLVNGYEIAVIELGERGRCEVRDGNGDTKHVGTYAACKTYCQQRALLARKDDDEEDEDDGPVVAHFPARAGANDTRPHGAATMRDDEMFTIQICRSHERNTTPQPWETVADHKTPAAAFRDAAERLAVAMPAGDAIRILDANGTAYGVSEFPHAYQIG